MNRRSFLTYTGLSAIAIAIGLGVYVPCTKKRKNSSRKRESRLAINLRSLFDGSFKAIVKNTDPGPLFATLRGKGVIDENGELDASIVNELARTDQAIEYNGRYYSQTEIELYSLAYLIHERDMIVLKGFDLIGGDYDAYKVNNAKECLHACESNLRCTGFTYVKDSHPYPDIHNNCYLKEGNVKYINDNKYISGTR